MSDAKLFDRKQIETLQAADGIFWMTLPCVARARKICKRSSKQKAFDFPLGVPKGCRKALFLFVSSHVIGLSLASSVLRCFWWIPKEVRSNPSIRKALGLCVLSSFKDERSQGLDKSCNGRPISISVQSPARSSCVLLDVSTA